MATCPECDADIEVDEYDVDKGDLISCPECGTGPRGDRTSRRSSSTWPRTRKTRTRTRRTRTPRTRTRTRKRTGTSDAEPSSLRTTDPAAHPLELEKEHAPARASCASWARSSSRSAAAWTAPTSPGWRPSALGDRALCVTADSAKLSRDATASSRVAVAREFGLRHEFIPTTELDNPAYRANGPDRCYYCKHELFEPPDGAGARARDSRRSLDGRQRRRSRRLPAGPAGGARVRRAQPARRGRPRPRREIRELSRRAGLPTWDQPASACLSSRIPYHSEVTDEKLRMIEQAEDVLLALGFRVCRVRHHGDLARLELGRDEMARALDPEVAAAIVRDLKAVGYRYVSLDLQGYRTGSLNETLPLRPI